MKELDDIRRLLGEVDGICERLAGGTMPAPVAANEWRLASDPPNHHSNLMVYLIGNTDARVAWHGISNWFSAESGVVLDVAVWSEIPAWPKGGA